MAATIGESISERIGTVRSVIEQERERTVEERQAFEAFADRVSTISPASQPAHGGEGTSASGASAISAGTRQPATVQSVDTLDAIRRAYEETVMDVSFYESEYGDTYEASVRAELGREVEITLTEPNCFTPMARRALLASVEQSTRERRELIETCDIEQASVDDVETVLQPVAEELGEIAEISLRHRSFGSLDAFRNRLQVLESRCADAARSRQRVINRQRNRHSLPIEEPDICAYIYDDLEATYPVLALCADLAHRASEIRRGVERAMSGGH